MSGVSNRQRLRAVQLMHRHLSGQEAENHVPILPESVWKRVLQAYQTMRKARTRGWHAAASQMVRELLHAVGELQRCAGALFHELQQHLAIKNVATLGDLYQDLDALAEEFPAVRIDLEQPQLSVTTEPVILEGIELGRFEIQLDWQRLCDDHPYRVVALDPNPAAANEDVTHPHVSGQLVCEGDGQAAIRRSLAEGRLYDFFLTVNRVLHTYAPGRAYVELDDWNGRPCQDCDSIVGEEDYCSCTQCEEILCCDCGSVCSFCDRLYCSGCTASCAVCESTTCRGCLQRCAACNQRVCPDCLTQTICNHCHEDQSESGDDGPQETESTKAAGAALYAHGLGQTSIPA